MSRTGLLISLMGILVISGFAVSNVYGETTIAVDDSGGADYTSIQDAVNNANDGDMIIVYTGTYTENVNVAKQLSIKSESGNPDDTIAQAADPNDHVFYVTADNVTISGFRVTGANSIGKHGIHLEGVTECDVTNNIVLNNWCGIYLLDSRTNTLRNNTVKSNANYGIFLVNSGNNTLHNNIVNSNNRYGIALDTSNDNNLSDNTVHSNNKHGIALGTSSHNRMRNNNIFNNTCNFGGGSINDIDTSNTVDGKRIYYLVGVSDATIDSSSNAGTVWCINCQNISIKDLTLKNNRCGICLHNTIDSDLDNNTASNNRCGIGIYDSNNNDLFNNTANANDWSGISLRGSWYNTLHNNTVLQNKYGIDVHTSQHNEIVNNNASNSLINSVGIEQALSDNNNLFGNFVSKNRYGIVLYKCNNNEIADNTLLSNTDCGIHLRYSDDNDLLSNIVRSSRLGIHLSDYSRNNTVKDNFLSENSEDIRIVDDSVNHTRNGEMAEFTISNRHEGDMDDFDLLENLKERQNIPLEEYMNRESTSYLPGVIATYGKLPEIATEEDCYRWFYEAAPAIMQGSRGGVDPYFTDGILVSYGPDVDGYIEVTIYENLTIETQPIMDEIYEIIDYEAKKMSIHEVPVVFFEGEFVRTDPLILVEGSDGVTSSDEGALGESTPGFGLLGGLISFFSGWLFRRNHRQRR